jgi:hypothetical protein
MATGKCRLPWAEGCVSTTLNLSDYDKAAAERYGGGIVSLGIRRVLSEPAGEDPLAELSLPAIVAGCINAANRLDAAAPRRRRIYPRKSDEEINRTRTCVDLSKQQRERAKALGKGSFNRGVSEALRQAAANKMPPLLLSELLEYAAIQAKALELNASMFETN